MSIFLMILSVVAGASKSLFSKGVGNANSDKYGLACSNVIILAVAFCVIFLYSRFSGATLKSPSSLTLITGVLFAVTVTMAQLLFMSAMRLGATSVTTFVYASGFILPTAAGVIFWKEALTVNKVIGTLLLIVALFLIVRNPDESFKNSKIVANRKSGLLWTLCAFGAMVCSGILGILQKVHQSSQYKDELSSFLLIAIGLGAITSLCMMFCAKNGHVYRCSSKATTLSLVCGVFFGTVNIVNLALAGLVPATVLFPVINGGNIILSSVGGGYIFHEKISLLKWIGIVVGLIAIVVVSR